MEISGTKGDVVVAVEGGVLHVLFVFAISEGFCKFGQGLQVSAKHLCLFQQIVALAGSPKFVKLGLKKIRQGKRKVGRLHVRELAM